MGCTAGVQCLGSFSGDIGLGQVRSPSCQWSDWRLAGPHLLTEWKEWPHQAGTGKRGRLWAGLGCDLIKRGQTGQTWSMSTLKMCVSVCACEFHSVNVCVLCCSQHCETPKLPFYTQDISICHPQTVFETAPESTMYKLFLSRSSILIEVPEIHWKKETPISGGKATFKNEGVNRRIQQ